MKRVEIKGTDNRDIYTTDVILENNTVVEINPINLFENMILNRDNEEYLKIFYLRLNLSSKFMNLREVMQVEFTLK